MNVIIYKHDYLWIRLKILLVKYLAITAVIALSAIMIFGAVSPSIAAEKGGNSDENNSKGGQNGGEKSPKYLICHYSGKAWKIMYVNGNALESHEKHTDGTLYDFVINHEDNDPSNDQSACLARN